MEKWKEKNAEKKRKKLIEDIKKKDELINKNKEEIKKMALELKDGKLVKIAEQTRGAPTEPTQTAAPVQQQPQQQQPQVIQPQQQTAQPHYQQPQMVQPEQKAANPFDNAITPEIPPQEFIKQPAVSEFSQEEAMRDVPINFVMTGGITFQFIAKLGNLQQILSYIAESINNQEVIELGNRLINPRQIVYYEY